MMVPSPSRTFQRTLHPPGGDGCGEAPQQAREARALPRIVVAAAPDYQAAKKRIAARLTLYYKVFS
jgi:hypothetical protein